MQYTEHVADGHVKKHAFFPRPFTSYSDILNQRKHEVHRDNSHQYHNGVPLTQNNAPNVTSIGAHFKDFTVPDTKSDKHSIMDPNVTRRTHSVYEQPDMSLERRELLDLRRHDLTLPDTMQHVSKYPETGGYHSTGPHPEIRFSSDSGPSYPVPVSGVKVKGAYTTGRELNSRVNTNRSMSSRSMDQHVHGNTYKDRSIQYSEIDKPEYEMTDAVKVTSESTLSAPSVQLGSDANTSFGHQTLTQQGPSYAPLQSFETRLPEDTHHSAEPRVQLSSSRHAQEQTQMNVHAREDANPVSGHTSINVGRQQQDNTGAVTLADMSLLIDQTGGVSFGYGDSTGISNARMLSDHSSSLNSSSLSSHKKAAVPSKVTLSGQKKYNDFSKTVNFGSAQDPRHTSVILKDHQVKPSEAVFPKFGSEGVVLSECRLVTDSSEALIPSASFGVGEGARPGQIGCKRQMSHSIDHSSISASTNTNTGFGQVQIAKKPAILDAITNFSGFIKGIFTDSVVQTSKESKGVPEPAQVIQSQSTVRTDVQPVSKITLNQLAAGAVQAQKKAPNKNISLATKKTESYGRTPGGNMPAIGKRTRSAQLTR